MEEIESVLATEDPMETLKGWINDAGAAGVKLPGAVRLATALSDGNSAARMVLFKRLDKGEVTRPDHWGGFALVPSRIEFWLEQQDRFHDRLVYERQGKGWKKTRLQP